MSSIVRKSFVVGLAALIAAQDEAEDCTENHPSCKGWAAIGECTRNPAYMLVNCRKACICTPVPTPAPPPTSAPTPLAETPAPTPALSSTPSPSAEPPSTQAPTPSTTEPISTPVPSPTTSEAPVETAAPTPAPDVPSPAPDPSGSTCEAHMTVLDGIDLAGELVEEFAGTIADCCARCELNAECQGYAYLDVLHSCYLKTNIVGTYPKSGCITHLKADSSAGQCSDYDEHQNSDLAGDFLFSRFAVNEDACCGQCNTMAECSGFAYVDNFCYFKARGSGYFGTFPKERAVTRIKSADAGQRRLFASWTTV